jgi:hypothetical protein
VCLCHFLPTFPAHQVPIVTTIAGAKATTLALKAMRAGPLQQVPLQAYFPDYKDDSNYLMTGMPTNAEEAAKMRR